MKPKKTIIPKAVTMNSTTDKEVEVKSSTSSDVEEKLNDHINNSDIHVDKQLKDSVSYLRKDVDSHLNNSNIHVTEEDKAAWNAKETPAGAQSKVNKVLNSLENHKSDYSIHITKTEKDSFKDKYTKAEVRNLVKHTLAGLKFLPAVNTRYEIESKYPDPDFNSAVYIRNAKTTLIFNGQNWVEFNGLFTPEAFIERYNFDLCNDLSNLLNRTVSMVNKYFDGQVPEYNGTPNEVDREFEKYTFEQINKFDEKWNEYEIANSIQEIWNLISRTNKYIDETMPWSLAKEEKEEELKSSMYHLIENLRNQMLEKAQEMCASNGVRFNSGQFNAIFKQAKKSAVGTSIQLADNSRSYSNRYTYNPNELFTTFSAIFTETYTGWVYGQKR